MRLSDKFDYTSIRLEVTSKCNLNCVYCHNIEFNNRTDDLSTSEILSIIDQLNERTRLRKILITGGEPTTQIDLVSIIKHVSNLGIKPDLVTNGKLLNEIKILELAGAGLKRIRLSIDGFVDDHDIIRKGSGSQKLWRLAEFIRQNTKMNLCIHSVCSAFNVDNLYLIFEKILSIGAHRWRVFDIGYKGNVLKNRADMGMDDYYNRFILACRNIISNYVEKNLIDVLDIEINGIFKTDILKETPERLSTMVFDPSELERGPCDYIKHQITIRANGLVTLCQYWHDKIADFKESNCNVEETLKNNSRTKLQDLKVAKVEGCNKCKYLSICHTGCRARANMLTGSYQDADPVGCFLMPLIYEKIVPVLPELVRNAYHRVINGKGAPQKYTSQDLKRFFRKHQFIY